jgi:hypothetical protein
MITTSVPQLGNAPLVLKAQIKTYDVDRIFMDAGSGINLIYAKTLWAMHISLEFLKLTDCSFHKIVPGSANYPFVTSQDFIKFWGFFFAFVLSALIEISQGFKTF